MKKRIDKYISLILSSKGGYLFGEALVAFTLFMSMVLLLLGNQTQEIQQLRYSEAKLAQTREMFQEVNARQHGISLHTGILVDFQTGKVEDMRDGQFKQIQIFNISKETLE
ncbi:hypothetical protein EF384_06140 [Aerococcus agrisoli]|uniref:Uncharacterized protein n=1 Tax=Aerococcus agrisoli TaxID=2487350 RepID=A0A3N4GD50_9LACT|nr:hypothetical protein [Aerococcus agrisoli]RPA60135.1 hypothetical protein EF384_06140 [Aerococcus agrisoli]